jgi:hypothetical protein
VTELHNSN